MALGYGGNPYGPAGTGKTESVKALGQAFARQVWRDMPMFRLRCVNAYIIRFYVGASGKGQLHTGGAATESGVPAPFIPLLSQILVF